MSFVLDASVIAKWYNQEPWSDKAGKLKEEYVQGRLRPVEPTLAFYEVGNAIRRNPQLTDQDAQKACSSLVPLLRDIEEAPDADGASAIVTLARSLALTYYDASYIHLARKHKIPLITADDEVVSKASTAVRVLHLKDL